VAHQRKEVTRMKKEADVLQRIQEVARNKREGEARTKRLEDDTSSTHTDRRSKSNSPAYKQGWEAGREMTGGRYASRTDGRPSERQATVTGYVEANDELRGQRATPERNRRRAAADGP
jgi:hypothetical protein